jgi:hypothetical protein
MQEDGREGGSIIGLVPLLYEQVGAWMLNLLLFGGWCGGADLKAANCFLAEDGSIKIGDMNVSKVMREGLLKVEPSQIQRLGIHIYNISV